MNVVIREISDDINEIEDVKEFLYGQIMIEYGIGPTPKFHYDIDGMKEYYISPDCNCMFVAWDGDKIVATAGIRAYDKDYDLFKGVYSKDDTASIWRLMVDGNYRRHGIARRLVNVMEDFAKNAGYSKIYLHTHRYLDAALPFWKSLGYKITIEEDDYDETTHMVKELI
ncbi:MAG: GNAT family N-acetyltransferase [Methanobrevibacter sp.]|jgi:GNAT superfamily N-acetyltransferase|uniref:GNAT family N-acetyltransferase n=1 Tax=Methanobrevibacter sp. TaxID=66852 RepID=UPI0025F2A3BD|nr:GNAT family N-acetyltransferase [Methanobrevibacter sp.]MBE6497625.1 GNAT family N-acetyltransferase [Methanobrevibacter sp.]